MLVTEMIWFFVVFVSPKNINFYKIILHVHKVSLLRLDFAFTDSQIKFTPVSVTLVSPIYSVI